MNDINKRVEEGIKSGEYVEDEICPYCGIKMVLKDTLHEVMRTEKYIFYTSPYICPNCNEECDIDEFENI